MLAPEIFECLELTPHGKNNEIQLTDAMRLLLRQQPMFGLRFKGRRYDVGNRLDFIRTNVIFALMQDELRDDVAGFIRELAARL